LREILIVVLGVAFMGWYLGVLKKYATFEGRAQRKEYWLFVLFNFLISASLLMVDFVIQQATNQEFFVGMLLYVIYTILVFLPALAVTVRRLHDTNHSGWWIFISLIPLIGSIILLVFLCQEGDRQQNKYGVNPKARVASAIV